MAFKTTLEKIKEAVEKSRSIPNPTIEYNFEELPEDKNITPDSFFGVKALLNNKLTIGNTNVTYKLQ